MIFRVGCSVAVAASDLAVGLGMSSTRVLTVISLKHPARNPQRPVL